MVKGLQTTTGGHLWSRLADENDHNRPPALKQRARTLLDQHGLVDWRVRLDHARRRAGCCYYQQKTISLSQVLLCSYPQSAIDQVILHEIAHALVGAQHKHDRVWKKKATEIGAKPEARLSAALPTPSAPWVGTCPRCNTKRQLYRSPRRVVSCAKCSKTFNKDLIFEWEHHGQATIPQGSYRRELGRLARF